MKSRKRYLIEAGMNSLIKAEECKNDHAQCYSRGWKFCPHCGLQIAIYRTCPSCKRNFFSAKAYRYHLMIAHIRPDGCPMCGKTSHLRQELKLIKAHETKSTRIWHCLKCDVRFSWRGAKKSIMPFERFDLPKYPN